MGKRPGACLASRFERFEQRSVQVEQAVENKQLVNLGTKWRGSRGGTVAGFPQGVGEFPVRVVLTLCDNEA
jgi:hypothetical protein